MMKYLVKRPWVGVSKGDVIETDNLHPALLPNVEVLEVQSFEVATPKAEEAETSEEPKLEVATPKPTQTRESKGKAK